MPSLINKSTPLHLAVRGNHLEVVTVILNMRRKKFDINEARSNGTTAAHAVCSTGNFIILKMLLSAGLNLEAKAINGVNCTYLAAKYG